MDISVVLSLAELFTIMFLGYFLVAWKIVHKDALKHFANFIFYVAMPAMIISSMIGKVSISKDDIVVVVVMTFALYGFLIALAFVWPVILKVDRNYIGLFRFMAIFGNVGFIGFPVLIAVLGKESLFYATIFNLPFNIFAFTLGVYFITMDTKKKGGIDYRKFLNPGIVATLIGLLIFFTGIKVPTLIVNMTRNLGSITTPLSLIIVGGSLFGVDLMQIFRKRIIFVYSFIKLILVPTAFALVVRMFGIDGMIASVAVILSAMPMGATMVILSQEYDGHVLEASEAVFVSTLLTGVTIPYIVFLIERLF